NSIRVHLADDAHAKLWLGVVDRVTSDDSYTGRTGDSAAAANNLFEQSFAQQLAWEADEVERKQWPGAHRIDVGQRVRGGDAAEVVRVVNNGREEIRRRDNRAARIDPVNSRVVGKLCIDEHSRIGKWDQVTQDLRQPRR